MEGVKVFPISIFSRGRGANAPPEFILPKTDHTGPFYTSASIFSRGWGTAEAAEPTSGLTWMGT
jgi:hypothetical protein